MKILVQSRKIILALQELSEPKSGVGFVITTYFCVPNPCREARRRKQVQLKKGSHAYYINKDK